MEYQHRLRVFLDGFTAEGLSVFKAIVIQLRETLPIIMQENNPSLVLSHDDILNTNLDCDALGIHYQVSTASKFLGSSANNAILSTGQSIRAVGDNRTVGAPYL